MPLILWCWSTTSKVNVGMSVELNLPANIQICFVAVWQMVVDGQSDRMVSAMEVCMKQRCVTEFLHVENIGPTDVHWCLLNVYRDQPVDVGTGRWWAIHFSSGVSDMKDKPHFGWACTAITSWNEKHSCKSADYDQETVCRAQYQLQCIGNNDGNTGILQSLCQEDSMDAHTGKKEHCMQVCQESKWKSMERQYVNSPLKEKFKTQPSAGKVMCSLFWSRKRAILLDFQDSAQTLNSDHYIMMLTKLKAWTSRSRSEKKTTFFLKNWVPYQFEDYGAHGQHCLDCSTIPTA